MFSHALDTEQFVQLQKDPTSSLERKSSVPFEKLSKNYQQMFMLSSTQQDCPRESLMVQYQSLREKCPNTELLLVRISCIRTEYGDLGSKSPYSVPIQENTDQK